MPAVDAEGAVRDWINSLTEDLVGLGNPLQLGAHLDRLRSPARGCYAWLIRVGGSRSMTAERPFDLARISASVYGTTKKTAADAASAYVAALESLDGRRTALNEDVTCQTVDFITGPIAIDAHATGEEQYRYLIDADFHLVLASALA